MNETDPDMIAASKEISRRAFLFYNVYVTKEISLVEETGKKVDIIYPRFDLNILPTRWKKMVECDDKLNSWNKLYYHLKKSKLSYRFSFYEWKHNVLFASLTEWLRVTVYYELHNFNHPFQRLKF